MSYHALEPTIREPSYLPPWRLPPPDGLPEEVPERPRRKPGKKQPPNGDQPDDDGNDLPN